MNAITVLDLFAFAILKARTLPCLFYNVENNLESVLREHFILGRPSAVSCPLTLCSNLFDGCAGDSSSSKRHQLLLTCVSLQRADVASVLTALWCDLAMEDGMK